MRVGLSSSRNAMNVPTEIQIINGADGRPAFVVIPYAQYVAQQTEADLIPHEVVSRIVDGSTPIRAWREYLDLTQDDLRAAEARVQQVLGREVADLVTHHFHALFDQPAP